MARKPPPSPGVVSTDIFPEEILINSLVQDKAYQMRGSVDKHGVARYTEAYKAGTELPPIRVARVGGVPFVVDGWHRLAALRALGKARVSAIVTDETKESALGLAATANLTHGLPLKNAEYEAAFIAYIKAEKHKGTRGRRQSYREIGAALSKPHTTIRNWTRRHFPKLYALMGGVNPERGQGGLPDGKADDIAHFEAARFHMAQARSHLRGVTDPHDRGTLLESARDIQSALEAAGPAAYSEF